MAVNQEGAQDRVGERVGVLAFKICGHCQDCLNDDHNLCEHMLHIGHAAGWGERDYYPGGMAEYCQVPLSCCVKMPAGLSYAEAACADFVAVATHAVALAGNIYNCKVAVVGAGPVGNSIAQIARSQGADVHILEAGPTACALLQKLSFSQVYQLEQEESFLNQHRSSCVAVWDSVGSRRSITTGLRLLGSKGRLINLATHDLEIPLNMAWFSKERCLLSASNNRHEDYPSALQAMSHRLINVQSMISRTIGLDEVPAMFETLLSEDKCGQFKVIIEPERKTLC